MPIRRGGRYIRETGMGEALSVAPPEDASISSPPKKGVEGGGGKSAAPANVSKRAPKE